eukprot:m.1639634 g.1639634  ORF g.1639634 m.1639634 type:complete len:311 (-) comp36943_c0_seq1:639-1571(-)
MTVAAAKPVTSNDRSPFKHLLAGGFSGVVTTTLLHPLDLIKVRFQAQNNSTSSSSARGNYSGVIDSFTKIIRNEGSRALYQGVSVNAIGSGTAWGLYFFAYEHMKRNLRESSGVAKLAPTQHMGAALLAGGLTMVATNPIWVVKTRMCLQVNTAHGGTSGNYRGLIHGIRSIVAQDGVLGLYRGLLPGTLSSVHGSVQFVVYEELKSWRNERHGQTNGDKLPALDYITLAAVSKICATAVTYPFQVMRTRLQNNTDGDAAAKSFRKELIRLWQTEGPGAFYRGLPVNILRVLPATCITFLVYENASHFLG